MWCQAREKRVFICGKSKEMKELFYLIKSRQRVFRTLMLTAKEKGCFYAFRCILQFSVLFFSIC